MADTQTQDDMKEDKGLFLTEEQASYIWENFFRANSLIRILKVFHEDNPDEFDSLNTLNVILAHMEEIRNTLDAPHEGESKKDAA